MLINLYLGTKNVEKALKKITAGPVSKKEMTWFPELVDKRKREEHIEYCINEHIAINVTHSYPLVLHSLTLVHFELRADRSVHIYMLKEYLTN